MIRNNMTSIQIPFSLFLQMRALLIHPFFAEYSTPLCEFIRFTTPFPIQAGSGSPHMSFHLYSTCLRGNYPLSAALNDNELMTYVPN